ncbi:MAG: thermonuclease family protein [Deltaproteobacteria bacterium]|nr:thermonuclease family protein [Deltaproteobacteria bacterium]
MNKFGNSFKSSINHTLIAVFILLFFISGAAAAQIEAKVISKVIDGDTIWLKGGEKVRYVGIDTPEIDEEYYEEAKKRNKELLGEGDVSVENCAQEPKDRYGRTLAWIYVEGADVGLTLLREGLAKVLRIPPCGDIKHEEYLAAQKEAQRKGLGLWSVEGP